MKLDTPVVNRLFLKWESSAPEPVHTLEEAVSKVKASIRESALSEESFPKVQVLNESGQFVARVTYSGDLCFGLGG